MPIAQISKRRDAAIWSWERPPYPVRIRDRVGIVDGTLPWTDVVRSYRAELRFESDPSEAAAGEEIESAGRHETFRSSAAGTRSRDRIAKPARRSKAVLTMSHVRPNVPLLHHPTNAPIGPVPTVNIPGCSAARVEEPSPWSRSSCTFLPGCTVGREWLPTHRRPVASADSVDEYDRSSAGQYNVGTPWQVAPMKPESQSTTMKSGPDQ